MSKIPDHMKANGWGDSFDPESYEETVCELCRHPIYRYQMDIIVEWKHFNHSVYCCTDKAVPVSEWRVLTDVPRGINVVYDNQDRRWEREGNDWVTYSSYIQRWSTAVTDLSGWGPFVVESRYASTDSD